MYQPYTKDNAVRCNKNTKSESYSQLQRMHETFKQGCALQQKY